MPEEKRPRVILPWEDGAFFDFEFFSVTLDGLNPSDLCPYDADRVFIRVTYIPGVGPTSIFVDNASGPVFASITGGQALEYNAWQHAVMPCQKFVANAANPNVINVFAIRKVR
jgi:hypothetical protein